MACHQGDLAGVTMAGVNLVVTPADKTEPFSDRSEGHGLAPSKPNPFEHARWFSSSTFKANLQLELSGMADGS